MPFSILESMDKRGQGALEYLLLIGGALIVAAIVVATILSVSSTSSGGATSGISGTELRKYIALGQARAVYTYDESSVTDSSGNGYNQVSGVTPTWIQGKKGVAMESTGQVRLSSAVVNGLADFTAMTWYKAYTATGNFVPLAGGLTIHINNTGETSDTQINGLSRSPHPFDSTLDGEWHHIAWVRQGVTETVYLDCTLFGTPVVVSNTLVSTSPNFILNGYIAGFSSATLDETYILSRGLTQGEIKLLAGC